MFGVAKLYDLPPELCRHIMYFIDPIRDINEVHKRKNNLRTISKWCPKCGEHTVDMEWSVLLNSGNVEMCILCHKCNKLSYINIDFGEKLILS